MIIINIVRSTVLVDANCIDVITYREESGWVRRPWLFVMVCVDQYIALS